MRIKAEDGNLFAVFTLRDVFERCDISDEDEPILAEIKKVYEENARYRELVEILRRDWLIEVSWDGLRKLWYVGLTDAGVRERDERDAKAPEAAKAENDKLRKLVRDMLKAMRMQDSSTKNVYVSFTPWFERRLHDLGIEVD